MNTQQKRNKFDSNFNSFSVKLCTSCGHAWEGQGKNQDKYWDFPKYGLQKKSCNDCKKKGHSDA